jgi:hypothetical protein
LKTTLLIGFFIALIAFNQIFSLVPSFSPMVYYLLMTLGLILGIAFSSSISFNGLMIWLITSAILSLVINTIPAFFQAPFRLLTFTIIIALVGPLMISNELHSIRIAIFRTLNRLILIFAVLSFPLYLIGIPVRQRGGFSGFFGHSMMLGPIVAIALVTSFYILFRSKTVTISKFKKQIIYVSIVFCFLNLLLSSSRAAISGAATGLLFFFFKNYKNRASKLISSLFVIFMLASVTFPAWSDFTAGIQRKQTLAAREGNMASSRIAYWEARILEFKQSPVYGIGFSTLSENKKGSNIQKKTGGIEPGTSWLAILSMIGILGFIPVFILFFRNLWFIIQDQINPLKSAVLGSLLIFFITHMFAEGYIFASGGFLFFYIWLLLGIIEGYRRNPSVEII